MIHHALWSESWTAAFVNHLWQSTLFVLIAWVVTLMLRNNQARTRYWIWMIASVKFLIPFSILIDTGEFLRTLFPTHIQSSALTAAIEQIAQPFPQTSSAAIMKFNYETPAVAVSPANVFALFLSAVWLLGSLAFMTFWARSWIRVWSAACSSTKAGILGKAPILISKQLLEPAAFGIFHPVLLLPQAINDRLSESQLNAVVAHELCHIDRRDNLSMAIHMIVQAACWFHPAVWWIKARLIDERERACDEAVLQSGTEAQLYAESILKVCRFCVESPLACASGVSRSDLKQRIGRIMTRQIPRKLDFNRKLVLSIVGTVVLAMPVVIGLAHVVQVHAQVTTENPVRDITGKKSISRTASVSKPDESPAPDVAYVPTMTFDVASVRESKVDLQKGSFASGDFSPQNSSHVRLTNFPLKFLVAVWAYGVQFNEIEGIPKELEMIEFDVEAKSDSATDERLAKLTKEQVRLEHKHMLQALLAERFKLKAHWEMCNGDTYELVVTKAGRLKSTGAPPSAEELKYLGDSPIPSFYTAPVDFAQFSTAIMYIGHEAAIADIVPLLSGAFKGPVVDKTGLTGKYDFNMKAYRTRLSDQEIDDPFPSLEKAIKDELGLKLVPSHGPVRKLIIDHIERPSEN